MYRYLFFILLFPYIGYTTDLQEAILHGLSHNPKIHAAQHDFSAKKLQNIQKSINGFIPTVSGSFVHNLKEDTIWPVRASISIDQQIFNFGSDIVAWYKGTAAAAALEAEFSIKKQQLILEVVKSYINVIEKQEKEKLYKDNVCMLEESLAAVKQRFEVGEVTKTILEKERAKLAIAKSGLIKATGDLNNARANYLHIVGLEAEDLLEPIPDNIGDAPTSLAEAIDQSLVNNLQVQSSALMSESAHYEAIEASTRMLPSLSMGISLTQIKKDNVSHEYDASIGLTTNIALFRGSIDYIRVQQAHHTKSQYDYNHIETTNAVKEAVTSAWNNFITIKSMVESSAQEVESARVVVESVKEEERLSVKTPLDVVEVENELLKAKVGYIANKMQYIVNLYNLMLLTQGIEIASVE